MIFLKDYIEIDQFLSVDDQTKLLHYFIHPSFPWAMSLDAVYGSDGITYNNQSTIGFYHTLLYKGEPCSEQLHNLTWVIDKLYQTNFKFFTIDKLLRFRIGFFTKNNDITPHSPHVDYEGEHWTCVYYVNQCDGDTVVYNDTFPQITQDQIKTNKFTEKYRCKPKMGKLVTFDGKYYHSSSYPVINPFRLAITFNFTVNKFA